ncbi:MAG: glycosyltransferase WbuB, partial [Candidatus Nealsonbacteria bacterium CG_4_9_14_0_8_um_filter_35_12]
IKTLRQAQGILFIYQRHSIFNVCGAILSLLTKTPLILEYNGSEPWVRQKWGGLLIFRKLCYFMENFSLKRAKIITVVSKPMKEELIKRNIPESKILVNYNGVDTEEFNPNIDSSEIRKRYNLEDKIVIGAVSTFGAWHGMPILAKAIKSIINKIQDTRYKIHFLFIGDGVQRPECERIIKENGMENYVTFTGIVPYQEVPQYLATCDILVSPHVPNPDGTPFFGSPTKLFEYMAMGKGIVASDLDQIGEVLKDRQTALLVSPGNIDSLFYGIIELIKDGDLRNTLGRNAREEVVKKYTWQQNVQNLLSFFKNS